MTNNAVIRDTRCPVSLRTYSHSLMILAEEKKVLYNARDPNKVGHWIRD